MNRETVDSARNKFEAKKKRNGQVAAIVVCGWAKKKTNIHEITQKLQSKQASKPLIFCSKFDVNG